MKILNYGSLNMDYVYNVSHIVQPGETILAKSRKVFSGGKGLNQSIAIAKAGSAVSHAGIIGEDGEQLLTTLQLNGVDTTYIKQVPGSSSHTFIQVDEKGQNCILVFAGAHLTLNEADLRAILTGFQAGDMILLQNELNQSPMMMNLAKQAGMKVAFNPSPLNEAIQNYPLESVDLFLLNELEGEGLTGEKNPRKILEGMVRRFPAADIVLTLGEKGVLCYEQGKCYEQAAFQTKVVDTTAAGDTFTGYFINGVLNNLPIQTVLERAAKASAIAVGRHGAAESIPMAREVNEA